MVSCLLLIYEFRSLFDVFIKSTTITHYKHLHFGRICSTYCIFIKSKNVWVCACVSLWFFIRASQNKYVCTASNQTEPSFMEFKRLGAGVRVFASF